MTAVKTRVVLAVAVTTAILMTACSKTEQGTQPAANAPATPASGLDGKSKEDLARIRELMEKEEARKQAQETKSKSLQEQMKDGSRAPVPTFGR
jgi:cell division protein FtsN